MGETDRVMIQQESEKDRHTDQQSRTPVSITVNREYVKKVYFQYIESLPHKTYTYPISLN